MRLTGERIVSSEGAFNASWQRHSACYAVARRFVGDRDVLDIGCGTGHAHDQLSPARVVGLDRDRRSLRALRGRSVAGDMRALPFAAESFGAVLCIHAVEHVRDPEPLLAETRRVLKGGGTAVVVTPNRLTFGSPDEIIDPYHYVEYDPIELERLCRHSFGTVEVYGLFGSPRYMEFHDDERRKLAALLRRDPLRLRRVVPRRMRQALYDWQLTRWRLHRRGSVGALTIQDFEMRSDGVGDALDLIAVCAV